MGNRAKGRRRTVPRTESWYPLSEVRDLIDQGRVYIRANALNDALRDFGWETPDVIDAVKRLQPRHFYKRDESKKKHRVVLDFYKAHGLKGEDVYIHFYIDEGDGVLVINSFKRI